MRRWMADRVSEAKRAETRLRRAEQIAEHLMETMLAERDLPPVIQLALARNPRAREGWNRMPASHRRAHLLGIFYYRNPESRARRLAKAIQEMSAYAERNSHPVAPKT